MPSPGEPRFIVLEGLDGAGTSTQTGLLAASLSGAGHAVCATAEPSEGPVGELLRSHVRREIELHPTVAALAFVADRFDHIARVIGPALREGKWVVCDRYLLSTLAYQGAGGVDRDWILAASRGTLVPDLTVFIEVSPDVLAQRLSTRGAEERYDSIATSLVASYKLSIDLLEGAGHSIAVVDGSSSPPDVLRAIEIELDSIT